MSKRKEKNKLKNNNNVKINGNNKPKTTTNLAQNSEFKVINSQTNNKNVLDPLPLPQTMKSLNRSPEKYQLSVKKQKYGYNAKLKTYRLESIETTKKRLVKEILCSTKSICTKILETTDLTLDPAKISNFTKRPRSKQ